MDVGNDALSEEAVLRFASEMLAATVGLDFPGRVILAGGAFKTLLHGRPPRDLDLWSPTPEERELLTTWLARRGHAERTRHAYSETLSVAGMTLELPVRTDSPTLDQLLARFDLALSAVGVELRNGKLQAVIHPRARLSAERREVLLLTPLANWKHALGTLARARRYADELGWVLPPTEEAAIWSVFDAQAPDEQRRMLERYAHTALPGWGVWEQATARACRVAGMRAGLSSG